MACDADGQGTPRQSQSRKAAAATVSVRFTESAEIDNIKKRLELTSNPGRTRFVLLMNETGQPIMYTGVKGKITWGGTRLTKPELERTTSSTSNLPMKDVGKLRRIHLLLDHLRSVHSMECCVSLQ